MERDYKMKANLLIDLMLTQGLTMENMCNR